MNELIYFPSLVTPPTHSSTSLTPSHALIPWTALCPGAAPPTTSSDAEWLLRGVRSTHGVHQLDSCCPYRRLTSRFVGPSILSYSCLLS